MSYLYNSSNEINNLKLKRVYLEDEDNNEINKYIQKKKVKLINNEREEYNSINFKQNLLPPSPPLDYMQCNNYYEEEEFSNFNLDQFETNEDCNSSVNNEDCSSSLNIQKDNNTQENNNRVFIFNSNVQHKKKYIPKFTIGYRSDCKKCRDGVPNHYGHIN